jgi:DNA-repair protein complementing XP-A cells
MDAELGEDELIEEAIREAEALYSSNVYSLKIVHDESGVKQCAHCTSVSTDDRLLRDFGISVCYNCKKQRLEEYRCISKSKAAKEYLLNDQHFSKLKFATVINPKRIGWNDMKLYLLSQVKNAAVDVWGSLEGVEEEKKRRSEAKLTKGKKKRKKNELVGPIEELNSGNSIIEKEVKRQRASASLSAPATSTPIKVAPLPNVFVKIHEHDFGPESATENPDEYKMVCKGCGVEVIYESL